MQFARKQGCNVVEKSSLCILVNSQNSEAHFLNGLQFAFDLC